MTADPLRNFTIPTEERIRAITIGAPAYSLRKRHIEDLEEEHVLAVVAAHDKVLAKAERAGAPIFAPDLDAALEEKAASIDLRKINALIEAHNRYYPIEANLRIDPGTGGYLLSGKLWQPEEPWTTARLVERARAILAARG